MNGVVHIDSIGVNDNKKFELGPENNELKVRDQFVLDNFEPQQRAELEATFREFKECLIDSSVGNRDRWELPSECLHRGQMSFFQQSHW